MPIYNLVEFKSVKAQTKFVERELSPIELRQELKVCTPDRLTRKAYEDKIEELNKQAEAEMPKLLAAAKTDKEKEGIVKAHTRDANDRTNLSKDWARTYKDGKCIIIGRVEVVGKDIEVISRSAVFLDIDHNGNNTRADFIEKFPYKAFIYDSFNSTEAEEKYRVIVPLAEELNEEEYGEAWEFCASYLPENCLDRTAKQFKRKFYSPRAMDGGLYSFQETKVKAILGKSAYEKHQSTAPQRAANTGDGEKSSRQSAAKGREKKQQKDPLSKSGYIGEFCKEYSIVDVVEKYLSDVYTKGSKPDRLTYMLGSTTDGVVIYGANGGNFCYSNHESDPASGRTCSAFDLVRIHKFGDTQESFKQMANEIIFNDERVQARLKANHMFAMSEDGNLKQTIDNCLIAFKQDPMLNGKIALNESDQRIYLLGAVDWDTKTEVRPITNTDYAGINAYLETKYGLSVLGKIEQAILLEAMSNKYDPVKDYLESLPEWDGKERIATLLCDYLNAENTPYTSEVTKVTLIGAIKRIYEQGCKFETMLVLVSPEEGIGKSTLFAKLAGDEFFSDQFDTLHGKESFEQLTGGWIIESAELEGMKKSDVNKIKQFLSKTKDKYRPAYGRVVENFKRRCIFVGTTNEDEFLRGSGANRRFYPVPCSSGAKLSVFDDLTQDIVNQLWAEAMVYYKRGDKSYLVESFIEEARQMQEAHKIIDDRVAMVKDYLAMPVPSDWNKKTLTERRMYREDPSKWKGEPVDKIPTIAIWFEVLNTQSVELSTFSYRESNLVRNLLAQVKDFRPSTGTTGKYAAYAQQRVWIKNKSL